MTNIIKEKYEYVFIDYSPNSQDQNIFNPSCALFILGKLVSYYLEWRFKRFSSIFVMLCFTKKNTPIGSKDRTAYRQEDTVRTDQTNMVKYHVYANQPIYNTCIRHAAVPLDPSDTDTCQKRYKMSPQTLTMDRPACDTIRTRAF
jgi:hypothetical protein